MISELTPIIKEAGQILLEHYDNHLKQKNLMIEYKADNSPVTQADLDVSHFVSERLKALFPYPMVSEESCVEYETRRNYDRFWLLDPLDGTKEFIAGLDEFCICLALIEHNCPALGIIYAPALGEFYAASEGKGHYYEGPEKKNRIKKNELHLLTSRFHNHSGVEKFIEHNAPENVLPLGSGLKFGRLAQREANIYLRLEGSSEWDIAAGHILVKEAGYHIVDLSTKKEPLYNKKTIRNNPFVVYDAEMKLELEQIESIIEEVRP